MEYIYDNTKFISPHLVVHYICTRIDISIHNQNYGNAKEYIEDLKIWVNVYWQHCKDEEKK